MYLIRSGKSMCKVLVNSLVTYFEIGILGMTPHQGNRDHLFLNIQGMVQSCMLSCRN